MRRWSWSSLQRAKWKMTAVVRPFRHALLQGGDGKSVEGKQVWLVPEVKTCDRGEPRPGLNQDWQLRITWALSSDAVVQHCNTPACSRAPNVGSIMGSLEIVPGALYWLGWKGCGRLIIAGFRGGGCFPHCQPSLHQQSKRKEQRCIEKQNKQTKERRRTQADTIVLALIAAKSLKERNNEVLKKKLGGGEKM